MAKKKIKIPKSLKNLDAKKVEVEAVSTDRGPIYRIKALLENGKDKLIGDVAIKPNMPGVGQKPSSYFIQLERTTLVHGDKYLGEDNSLDGAKRIGYGEAMEIAQEIARANNVDLEDKVSVDNLLSSRNDFPRGGFPISILFILVGLTLSISSTSTTGYAISNVTQTSQGLAGIFLFVIGLVGLVFSLKKK
jgi:hypothetical protein